MTRVKTGNFSFHNSIPGRHILIIEDEPTIAEFLKTGLAYEGYGIVVATDGKTGLECLRSDAFDLIILDIILPDMDGFEVCRRIRTAGIEIPILMLTARKEISDRVTGLDIGADDYMTKPFSFDELLARIRAVLRRAGRGPDSPELRASGIVLNTDTRAVLVKGRSVHLTPTEFSLLEIFMQHPHRVFTRDTLLNRVWGYHYGGGTNIVDVHVSHLRDKIGDRPSRLIRTHYGIGYAFYPED